MESYEFGPVLRVLISPEARFVHSCRERVQMFLRAIYGTLPEHDTLLIAVGEALANAVEHSRSHKPIEVQCCVDDQSIAVTIIDYGKGIQHDIRMEEIIPLPNVLSEHGRGIPLMKLCVDSVSIEAIPEGGTKVTLQSFNRLDHTRHTQNTKSLRLALSLEIAKDAERASVEFWKLWLWRLQERRTQPTYAFCAQLAERFGVSVHEVSSQWLEWYGLLTSWDLAPTLTGRNVREMSVFYGRSHRKT